MKCHQILTGAANRGDRTFGVGAVEGVPFTAYSAGCNVVILSSSLPILRLTEENYKKIEIGNRHLRLTSFRPISYFILPTVEMKWTLMAIINYYGMHEKVRHSMTSLF